MQHLFDAWKKVEYLLRRHDIFLFLDYDGTLTPIAERPELAKLSRQGQACLKNLSFCEGVGVAIVSGRSLGELKRKVRVRGIYYAGNHGLEFEGGRLSFKHAEALRAVKRLAKLCARLEKAFRAFPGVLVENKVLTLSVHYRQVPSGLVKRAKVIFLKAVRRYRRGTFVVRSGKKVWEIRPATRWNKGKMVLWLLDRVRENWRGGLLPIYVGDDQTDEDAFRSLTGKGICIKVTDNPGKSTAAPFYVHSPGEVLDFLDRVKIIREGMLHAYDTFSFPHPLAS